MSMLLGANCCCTKHVCWHRYNNQVPDSGDPLDGGTPGIELGGPTEDPGSGSGEGAYSRFWNDRTPGNSFAYGTTNIKITGNARIINLVTIDQEISKVHVHFFNLLNGARPRIFFDVVDDTTYCYLEFECDNNQPGIAMKKVVSGVVTKLRRISNHHTGVTFDGTSASELTLGISLARGQFFGWLVSSGISPNMEQDDTHAAFKIGGSPFVDPSVPGHGSEDDFDDEFGITDRFLQLGKQSGLNNTSLPILPGDSSTKMASGSWGVGGIVGSGSGSSGDFDIDSITAENTTIDSPGAGFGSPCPPDVSCSGLLTERPLKISLGGTGVVETGKIWIDCGTGMSMPAASSPGSAWQVLEEAILIDDVNEVWDADWSPIFTGPPLNRGTCFWTAQYFNPNYPIEFPPTTFRTDPRVTNIALGYTPCGSPTTTVAGDGEISVVVTIDTAPNIFASLVGAGIGNIAGTWAINTTAGGTFDGRIMPAYWKPSDVEGKPLKFIENGPATNDPSTLVGYEFQELTLGIFTFQDSD